MDGRQAQLAGPGVDEAVCLTRRTDHDMAGLDHHRLVADLEGGLAGLDNEDFGVRVAVKLGPDAGLRMHEDDAERNLSMVSADELVCVHGVLEVVEGDDRSRLSVLIGQRSASLLTWIGQARRPGIVSCYRHPRAATNDQSPGTGPSFRADHAACC